MELKLIVVRTADPEKLAGFYTLLGLVFDYHKHGNSPHHYSTTIGTAVLEIYPLAKGQEKADNHFRLGLGIDDFDKKIALLKENQVVFSMEPAQTDFGYMAVILDPDGRKVEIYKS
jgi:catechol 2,3-dioxygenase-like lactoylglutathione lyase family enzyme